LIDIPSSLLWSDKERPVIRFAIGLAFLDNVEVESFLLFRKRLYLLPLLSRLLGMSLLSHWEIEFNHIWRLLLVGLAFRFLLASQRGTQLVSRDINGNRIGRSLTGQSPKKPYNRSSNTRLCKSRTRSGYVNINRAYFRSVAIFRHTDDLDRM
jgi:hypothetical protein